MSSSSRETLFPSMPPRFFRPWSTVVVVENDRGGRCRGAGGAASPRPTRPRAATRGWRWSRKAAGGPSAARRADQKVDDRLAAADAVAEPPSAAAAAAAAHVLKATTVHELCLVECVMRWEVALSN